MIHYKNLISSLQDSFVFIGSMLISTALIYPIIGIQGGIAWSSFAVLCTYSLYNAKPDRSNLLYVSFWMLIIMSSTYIGRFLHLSPWFYLYLFIIAYCYYFFFGRDPVFDRAIRFIIILSTIGTTLPHITEGLPMGAFIGTVTALIVCHYMMRKHYDLAAFKQGIFTQDLFKLDTNIIPRAFIYSLGMFICLWLPLYFGLNKNYWATLTFIMVMTPKAENVVHNTLLRFIGSLAAVTLLFLLFQLPHIHDVIFIALFFFSFILPLCFSKNFAIVTFAVTCYSLVLVEISGYWQNPTYSLLMDRILETCIGGLIAIFTSIILKAIRSLH